MTTLTIQIPIAKSSWLVRKVIYFPVEHIDFFPSDALMERHKGAPSGNPVTFHYGDEQSTCAIVVRRSPNGKIIQMRPEVTGGAITEFFKENTASVGDFVTITKVDSRKFEVRLVKPNGTTV